MATSSSMKQETRRLLALLTDQPLRVALWTSLGLLMARPLVGSMTLSLVVDLGLIVTLIVVVRRLIRSRAVFFICGALLLMTLLSRSLREWDEGLHDNVFLTALGMSATVTSAVFSLFVLGLLLNYAVRAPMVTLNTVLAAINAYVLIGVVFGFVYLVLYERTPSAFTLDLALGSPEVQLRYFSMVTLTTVGYGDIVPRGTEVRAFAATEALVGQIYLAAIVARIVGIQGASASAAAAAAAANSAAHHDPKYDPHA